MTLRRSVNTDCTEANSPTTPALLGRIDSEMKDLQRFEPSVNTGRRDEAIQKTRIFNTTNVRTSNLAVAMYFVCVT